MFIHTLPPKVKIFLSRDFTQITLGEDVNPHLARHLCSHPESGEDIVTPRVVRLQYQTRQPTQLPRTLRHRNLRSIPGNPVTTTVVRLRKSALVPEDRTDAITEDPLLRLDILRVYIVVKAKIMVYRILPLRHILEEILSLRTTQGSPRLIATYRIELVVKCLV